MRRLSISVILVLLITSCSDPKDLVFGTDSNLTTEQQKTFVKLPEEDRMLLAGYIGVNKMSEAFGGEAKPLAGRTVGEVLVEARAWKVKVLASEAEGKKQEAEAEALKNKVLTERKAMASKISASVVVAIVDKTVLPKDYDAGRFNAMLSLKYAIENKSDKTILQLKGQVTFKDATGDEVGTLSVDIDEPVHAGQTLTTTTGRGWELNEFMNGEIEKIASRDFTSMKTSFEPESIAFEGGEVLKAPSLP